MAPESWSAWAAWAALVGSTASGIYAAKGFVLAKRHDTILRGDDELVGGRLQKPDLYELDHRRCVLWTTLVNRSSRKSVISGVIALDTSGQSIDIKWAGRTDSVGNPEGASGILAVGVSADLFLRRTDGKQFQDRTVVKVFHNFPGSPLTLKYEEHGDWLDWLEK